MFISTILIFFYLLHLYVAPLTVEVILLNGQVLFWVEITNY